MSRHIYIGTSGWHYDDWTKLFYPAGITGYHELTYHAQYFNTVENNSSFYRTASEPTYKTWDRMTPPGYLFSLKLHKLVTHTYRLELHDEVVEKVRFVLAATQVLGDKRGTLLIQLPASFHYDLKRVQSFLDFLTAEVRAMAHPFDIAIEFRHASWFTDDVFALLEAYDVALVAGQSSRWPGIRRCTATTTYIRMHGPEKLFASSYTDVQLGDLATYISSLPASVKRVYVYFNNDFHGYALDNAKSLMALLDVQAARQAG